MKKTGRSRKTRQGPPEKTINIGVELRESVRRRLKLYAAKEDVKQKAVVNEAIDEYLKKRGA